MTAIDLKRSRFWLGAARTLSLPRLGTRLGPLSSRVVGRVPDVAGMLGWAGSQYWRSPVLPTRPRNV
jgi:hypothetical protein